MSKEIVLNPAIFNDKRDATATAWNEGLRLWMDDAGFEPQFEFTPEQQTFFAKTAYSQDASAMRKTIVARIATRDNSIPRPSEPQISETMRLLQEVGDSIGKFHKDAGVVKALMQDLQTRAPAPEQAAEAPVTEGTEQMAQGAGNVEESPTLDLTKSNILLRSLTETEAPFIGGYMDSVSKSKPGVLTVGEGLTYITDDAGNQKPATIEWLSQFKNREEMKAELDKQRTRYLIKMQRDLEPQLKQLDEPTQALVANVAFNRGNAKAKEYADSVLKIPDPKQRYETALALLAPAGTAKAKLGHTVAVAKGRYEALAALKTADDAVTYGKNWENAPLRETTVASREALADKLYVKAHSKWGWKNKPAEQAKLKAINERFKK